MFLSIFSGVFGVQVGFPYLSGNLPPIPSIYIYLYSHLNPLYFSLLFLHPSLSLSALIPLLLHLRGSTFYPPFLTFLLVLAFFFYHTNTLCLFLLPKSHYNYHYHHPITSPSTSPSLTLHHLLTYVRSDRIGCQIFFFQLKTKTIKWNEEDSFFLTLLLLFLYCCCCNKNSKFLSW